MNKVDIRRLDVDDLYIIKRIGDGVMLSRIASELLLTPPALSHRVQKYRKVFGQIYVQDKKLGRRRLTHEGRKAVVKCAAALEALMTIETVNG